MYRLLSAQERAWGICEPICYSRDFRPSMLLKKLVSWLVEICNTIALLARQSRLWRRFCTVCMRSGSIKHHLCVSYRRIQQRTQLRGQIRTSSSINERTICMTFKPVKTLNEEHVALGRLFTRLHNGATSQRISSKIGKSLWVIHT